MPPLLKIQNPLRYVSNFPWINWDKCSLILIFIFKVENMAKPLLHRLLPRRREPPILLTNPSYHYSRSFRWEWGHPNLFALSISLTYSKGWEKETEGGWAEGNCRKGLTTYAGFCRGRRKYYLLSSCSDCFSFRHLLCSSCFDSTSSCTHRKSKHQWGTFSKAFSNKWRRRTESSL